MMPHGTCRTGCSPVRREKIKIILTKGKSLNFHQTVTGQVPIPRTDYTRVSLVKFMLISEMNPGLADRAWRTDGGINVSLSLSASETPF